MIYMLSIHYFYVWMQQIIWIVICCVLVMLNWSVWWVTYHYYLETPWYFSFLFLCFRHSLTLGALLLKGVQNLGFLKLKIESILYRYVQECQKKIWTYFSIVECSLMLFICQGIIVGLDNLDGVIQLIKANSNLATCSAALRKGKHAYFNFFSYSIIFQLVDCGGLF